MADDVLSKLEDVESYSFYGLSHWLSELGDLLDRADQASVSKAPKAQETALLEQRPALLEAQTRVRHAMGGRLEEPLTKREKPLAEAFLQEQISKLKGQALRDERAKAGIERLQQLLEKVRARTVAAESKAVRDVEASMKQAETDWKELAPIYDKWQAGRHSFRSNADLQTFKRRYEDCKKVREAGEDKLNAALRARRSANAPEEPAKPKAGWSSILRKPTAAPAAQRAPVERGAAAMALDAKKASAKASAKSTSWTSQISLAQRLQAEAAATVRQAAEPQTCAQDDGFWTESVTEQPPPPPVPKPQGEDGQEPFVAAKSSKPGLPTAPTRAPLSSLSNTGRRWAAAAAVAQSEDEDQVEAPVHEAACTEREVPAASAKKRGKAKPKRPRESREACNDNETAPAAPTHPRSSRIWSSVEALFSGALVSELLRPSAWRGEADARLAELADRLPPSVPLGLALPLSWAEFLSLEMDGGPKRTSRRGETPWLLRLQSNVPWLLPHYVTVIFALVLLHSLSRFGILMWLVAAQTFLLLLPPQQVRQFGSSAHVVVLQCAHLLLWIFFVRSLWQLHIFIQIFLVLVVCGHAYAVNEAGNSLSAARNGE